MDGDGFTVVRRKSRRRPGEKLVRETLDNGDPGVTFRTKSGRKVKAEKNYLLLEEDEEGNVQGAVEWVETNLEKLRREVNCGKGQLVEPLAASLCQTQVAKFDDMICLGVGRLSTMNAQRQLAVAMELLDRSDLFDPDKVRKVMFDPDFRKWDRVALERCGFDLLDDNNSGKIHDTKGKPTLFYMPHCDIGLYNNVLCTNWSRENLCKIVIIGNSFASYVDRLVSKDSPCVDILAKYVTEVDLPLFARGSTLERAFNDTRLLFFSKENLDKASDQGCFENQPTFNEL